MVTASREDAMAEGSKTAGGVVVPPYEMDALDEKVVAAFPGKVVRKDLTALMKRGSNVPTFVLEYLLGMYCTTTDVELAQQGLSRIDRIITENYVRPDESERIKSAIRERGQYTVIDKVSAHLDEQGDIYVARFANLDIDPFVMPDEYVRRYQKILMGGIWCIARIEYLFASDDDADPLGEEEGERPQPRRRKRRGPEDSPFHIVSLTPIQMPNLDLDDFVARRSEFTSGEWRALILRSAGYEPSELEPRQQLHFLERLVPLVEHNYNMCELGPRGTGKSHVYTEVSPYSYLLSGGQTTTAKLFASLSGHGAAAMGLVGHWDAVAFDEVAGMHFRDLNAIQTMKGYMASGTFGRGTDSYNADASLVFEGNINDTPQNVLKTTHLFDPFPPEFNQDSAFFDRIHCYLPGWEVPKMRSSLLTGRYGLITDCLSEFCREMRRRDFSHLFDEHFRLNSDFNQRDEIAVRKTFSGLAKLLFPDGRIAKEEVRQLLEYSIEGRRRVKEQLKIMAGIEFMDVALGYSDVDEPGSAVVVEVPEQATGTLVPTRPLQAGHVFGVGRSLDGEMAVYRLENRAVPGECAFRTEGLGGSRAVRETMVAAFEQLKSNGSRLAPGMRVGVKDYLLFLNDLQGRGPSLGLSLAEFVGLCSAASGRPVVASLVIPGVLRLSGTLEVPESLEDVFRVAKNAGARKILLPQASIADLQSISLELIGSVSPVFYETGNALDAARKALDL